MHCLFLTCNSKRRAQSSIMLVNSGVGCFIPNLHLSCVGLQSLRLRWPDCEMLLTEQLYYANTSNAMMTVYIMLACPVSHVCVKLCMST